MAILHWKHVIMTNAYITSYASGSAIVLVQESAADGYCLQIMVKENLTLYELVGGTEIVSDNCSRMGEINNPNRPYFYLHACP